MGLVVSLGHKHLYLMRHLTDPNNMFFKVRVLVVVKAIFGILAGSALGEDEITTRHMQDRSSQQPVPEKTLCSATGSSLQLCCLTF